VVSIARRGEGSHRSMAAPLQPITTKWARIRASAISRRTTLRLDRRTQRPSSNGARALRYVGLRALARCTTSSARSTCRKQGTPSQTVRGPNKRRKSLPCSKPRGGELRDDPGAGEPCTHPGTRRRSAKGIRKSRLSGPVVEAHVSLLCIRRAAWITLAAKSDFFSKDRPE
jgi:hypothetical protein